MRQFAKKRPTFYTGATGRTLRRLSGKTAAKDAFMLADYLIAGPNADAYGLYVLEPETVLVHLPMTLAEFEAACIALEDAGFCRFDRDTRWVWVIEMAAHQLDAPLKPQDNIVRSLKRWYETLPKNPFLGAFFDRYATDLCLGMETERSGPPVARREEWAPRPAKRDEPAVEDAGEFALAAPGPATSAAAPSNGWRQAAFDRFWKTYPKKVDKRDATAEYAKVVKTEAQATEIQAGLERLLPFFNYAEEGRFILSPYRWLKRERWHDEPSELPNMNERTHQTAKTVARAAQRGAPR